ncbi:hypothetical protein [Sphingobacterium faecium]
MIKYLKYLLFFVVLKVNAQDLTKLTLQTPNAAALGRYEDMPVEESTGIPNISLHLFNLKVGDIDFPISLSYHAGGVKVDQLESQVGLGWSLLGFPNLSRDVRGVPDEKRESGNFFSVPISTDEIEKRTSNLAPYNVGDMLNWQFLSNLKNDLSYDLTPDMFHYSLRSVGGKFFYSRNREFITIPFKAVKVQHFMSATVQPDIRFNITDESGIIYDFNSRNVTISDDALGQMGSSPYNLSVPSSWNISKIKLANATDSAVFNYNRYSIEEVIKSEQETIGKTPTPIAFIGNSYSRDLVEVQTQYPDIKSAIVTHYEDRITEIKTNNILFKFSYLGNFLSKISIYNSNGEIIKSISFSYNEGMTAPNRTFLTSVKLYENSVNPEKYQFYYNDLRLPDRSTLAALGQDYWGYFNGASNTRLLPKVQVRIGEFYKEGDAGYQNRVVEVGTADRNPSAIHKQAAVLNRIVYPTGLERKFYYSSNYYSRIVTGEVLKKVGGRTNGKGRLNRSENMYTIKAVNPKLIYNENQYELKLNLVYSPPVPISVMAPDDDVLYPQNVYVVDKSTNSIVYSGYHNGNPNLPLTISHSVKLDPSKEYELKVVVYGDANVTTSGGYSATYVDAYASWEELKTEKTDLLVAGLKIDKIEELDRQNLLSSREFYYNEPYVAFEDRLFYKNYTDVKITTPQSGTNLSIFSFMNYFQRQYFGTSSFSTINFKGSPVIYKQVKSIIRDASGIKSDTLISNYAVIHEAIPSNIDEFIKSSSSYGQFNPSWADINLTSSKVKSGANYKKESSYNYSSFKSILDIDRFRLIGSFAEYRHADVPSPYPFTLLTMSNFYLKSFPISRSSQLLVKDTESIDGVVTTSDYNYSAIDLQRNYVAKQISSGPKKITKILYPNDIGSTSIFGGNLTADEFSGIQKLNANNTHQLNTVIQEENYIEDVLIGLKRNTYENIGNMPHYKRTYTKFRNSDNMVKNVEVISFDSYSNPREVKKQEEPVNHLPLGLRWTIPDRRDQECHLC